MNYKEYVKYLLNEKSDYKYMKAYHGSPYKFDRFDKEKAGTQTGQVGADVGLFFATTKKEARASISYSHDISKQLIKKKDELAHSLCDVSESDLRFLVDSDIDYLLLLVDHRSRRGFRRDYIKDYLSNTTSGEESNSYYNILKAIMDFGAQRWLWSYHDPKYDNVMLADIKDFYGSTSMDINDPEVIKEMSNNRYVTSTYPKDKKVSDILMKILICISKIHSNEYQNILKKYEDDLYNKYNKGYLYTVKIKYKKMDIVEGEEIGTNIGRESYLLSAEREKFDIVLIKFADTGYYLGDEIIVFDDKNIEIINVEEIEF